jgi:predicted transcriptional regulator
VIVNGSEVDFCSRKGFHNYLFIPGLKVRGKRLPSRGIRVVNGKRQYRSRIQIAANILEIAKEGSRKTKIMYLGNLSFDLLQKYLEMLVNYELLEVHGGPDKGYIATEKGKQFLEDYYELQKYSEIASSKKRALESTLAITP